MSGGNGVDFQAMFDMIMRVSAAAELLQAQMTQVQADIRDLKHGQSELKHGQSSIRSELAHYHASVMGHGILITELDERVRRIEQRLDIHPAA